VKQKNWNVGPEETLDPNNWESMRKLGHNMLDDMMNYMETVRKRPVWQHLPEQVKVNFSKPVPEQPQPPEEIYEEFVENVLPYPMGNIHPRFWGWILGTGTVMGAFAELLAASMNTNTGGGGNHIANHVEKQVIDWIKEMLGYPQSASGVLTSGCSAANIIGLTVARNAKAGFDLRREGLQRAKQRMVLYASQEIHSSIQKAAELLGLGSEALRLLPVNNYFQIDLKALRTTIKKDRDKGYRPFCVVGAAGTTNTGSGGGGSGFGSPAPTNPGLGGAGGSGIVVVRAPNAVTFTAAPGTNTVSPVGSCTVATFTVSGTLTVS